jgi:dihydrofolate reductase
MRNVILLMHVSLDGFVAGPNGEMDWIRLDDELVGYVAALTATADTALFGRVTYQMMEGYWPTAAASPTATQHDVDHATWVNPTPKIVFSRTLQQVTWQNSRIVADQIPEEIARLKAEPGKNMLMIGSARTAHTFMQLGLIDEYRINVNPVILGGGMPLFPSLEHRAQLQLSGAKTFPSQVVGLHYQKA